MSAFNLLRVAFDTRTLVIDAPSIFLLAFLGGFATVAPVLDGSTEGVSITLSSNTNS